ncbi:Predicted arabinose efflux permease, MFS family [Burkholderia sp. 8Y]|uniref:MFS transporter n=1 Tax=Burkholderia sp. 8Y TaxID=2653133 RepID=UPI0012F3AECF|nr:MFS transporter [Burkholderia sp. 8Y]VXB10054.1 Predicted arabinose efflux permease, MFS family [Burkholderia sp. 8Y]
MPAYLAVALVFSINMAGTTLPTAIYHDYQTTFGFSPATITVIFASYALGVLGALLVMGNWSDQLGRKRMLTAGLTASAISALTFLFANGLAMLLLGRLISGISAGIFTGTATVAVIESSPTQSRAKAMLAATSSNMLGLGLGPVLSGALVEFAPWPMRLAYVAHIALLLLALLLLRRAPETVRVAEHPELRMQRIALPREVRTAFIPAALSGFAGFVVVGFFTAVSPQLMRNVLGYRSGLLIGLAVFLIFFCSAIGQAVEKRIAKKWRQRVGGMALVVGLIQLALCAWQRSSVAFVVGTILCGIGQGISFRAALGELSNRSPAERKAEVTSAFFVVLYVAISLPVIGIGVAVQGLGIAHATMTFAAITVVIVLLSLALLLRVESE